MSTSSKKATPRKTLAWAVAGTAAALAPPGAQAGIISATDLAQDVPVGTSVNDIGGMSGLNINREDTGETKLEATTGALLLDSTLFGSVPPGTVIGPGSALFGFQGADLTGDTSAFKSGLFGVRFNDPDSQFGWVEVLTEGVNVTPTVTLNGWGYQTQVGRSIAAGATVDEPGSLALLAAGAIGFAAALRRRAVKPSAAAHS